MVVVSAFGVLTGTENAGLTAYYRAPDCDSLTIAEALPLLSKIDYYEDAYIIGEMLIWDQGIPGRAPNNCSMVRVIVYNDGWICTWFDKTDQNQLGLSGAQWVSATVLSGWGSSFGYEDRYNGCQLKITGSDNGVGGSDPDCPDGTIFTIYDTDTVNGNIVVHSDLFNSFSFHSGYSYNTEIYMTNGSFLWWRLDTDTLPVTKANRLYRAIYEIWYEIKESSNSSNISDVNATKVYLYSTETGNYSDDTTDFNDIGTDDVPIFPTTAYVGDAMYIGYATYRFSGVTFTVSTAAVGSDMVWEYWNGTAWTTLTCTDGTNKFTTSGDLTFTVPSDWETCTVYTSAAYYWIRAIVTVASYTTSPKLTQGQLHTQNDVVYTDAEFGVYTFEYTSANYLLLCGIGTPSGGTQVGKYYYTTVLPGKTLYDHIITWSTKVNQTYTNLYFNGYYIYNTSGDTNGYIRMDVSDMDNAVGTQDAHLCTGNPIYMTVHYASVLITS